MATTLNTTGVLFPSGGNSQAYIAPVTDGAGFGSNLGTSSGDPFGYGWANGTGTRSTNQFYLNTTGKPLVVMFSSPNYANESWRIYVAGIVVRNVNNYGTTAGCTFIVPPGATYRVGMSHNNNTCWYEY
jgi:hypothetical protein